MLFAIYCNVRVCYLCIESVIDQVSDILVGKMSYKLALFHANNDNAMHNLLCQTNFLLLCENNKFMHNSAHEDVQTFFFNPFHHLLYCSSFSMWHLLLDMQHSDMVLWLIEYYFAVY